MSDERFVIVRAFADEPVKLRVLREDDKSMRVTHPDGNTERWIGWTKESIYEWDESWYAELRAAYESGDQELLHQTWRRR